MKTIRLFYILLALISMSCSKEFLNNCDSKSSAFFKPIAKFKTNIDGKYVQFINESENAESFEWDFGNNEKSTDKNPSKDFNENKTYTVKLTAKRCGGEIADIFTSNVKIDCPIIDGPTITANSNTTICSGQSVQLTASCSSGNTLIWGNSQTSSVITVTTSGTYTATCKNTSTGCLTKASEKVVTVTPLPTKPIISNSLNKVTLCTGETTILSTSCPSGTTLSWNTEAISTSINVSTTGTYSATCKNAIGCTANSDKIVISVTPKPAAPSISTNSDNQCNNVPFTLTASACTGGTINWTTGGTSLGSGTSLSQAISTDKNFTAVCTVNGCSSPPTSKVIFVIPLATVTTVTPIVSLSLVSATVTFRAALNFQTASNIGEVKEYGFVYADGNKDPIETVNSPTKVISVSSTKNSTRLLEKNLNSISYSSDNLTFALAKYRVSYRAYVVRCDGSMVYGDLLKTFN